jgi:hypothetical protein
MPHRRSVRTFVALVSALALACILIAGPGAAFAMAGIHVAQDDSGDTSQGQSDNSPPAQAAQTSLDPCQLVTSSEASTLAGANFGAGMESTTDAGGRICVYGYQTTNVFMVLVGQAADAATAQANWAEEESRVQNAIQSDLPAGVNLHYAVTEDAGVLGYDRSATATASATIGARTLNVSGIYLLAGATFVSFSDVVLDAPAASADTLGSQAQTVLTRLS